MANIMPFRALRYNTQKAGNIDLLCCPPYDIIPDCKPWLNRSPYNVIRLEKPEGENAYARANHTLNEWISAGILAFDQFPSFYLYEIEFTDTALSDSRSVVSGILARLELTPFSDGIVLPHENTLSKAKADRLSLMLETGCQFSPIYCLYEDKERNINRILANEQMPPPLEMTMPDGTIHRLRTLNDPSVCRSLSEAFRQKKLFIADGHHRYETALAVSAQLGEKASPFILTMLTDMQCPGLLIYPTHRILSGIEKYSVPESLMYLEASFEIDKDAGLTDTSLVYITSEGEYRLTPKFREKNESDTVLLHTRILEPLFGIDKANMAAGKNLTYTRSIEEARTSVLSKKAQCAFLINPTKLTQIRDICLSGGRLPQKSTYFYPKLITGLVINKFLKNESPAPPRHII